MLINIQEIQNEELLIRTEDFAEKGGALHFHFFQIVENYKGIKPQDPYSCHLVVARQSLERIHFEYNYHWNRSTSRGNRNAFPIFQTDFEELDSSGIAISLEEFLGPFYDLELAKPLVRGIAGKDTLNSYFYYDSEEEAANIVDLTTSLQAFRSKYPNQNGSFIYAFMEPPYSLQTGKNIWERGQYLIDFMDFVFSDMREIYIMKWSTDCSPFFDAGKEWWGSYFWTVYNPKQDWYVGICGSETD